MKTHSKLNPHDVIVAGSYVGLKENKVYPINIRMKYFETPQSLKTGEFYQMNRKPDSESYRKLYGIVIKVEGKEIYVMPIDR